MPILSRSGPRLLRQVGGRAHASEAEHEEPRIGTGMRDEDIHAEPMSSGEEDVQVKSSQTSTTSVGPARGRGGKAGAKKSMRAPARGAYQRGRKSKGKENVGGEVEKEEEGVCFGMGSTPKKKRVGATTFGKTGLGAKRKAEEVDEEEGKIYWGMGDTPPKRARTMNVHAVAAGSRGFGKKTTFSRAKRMYTFPFRFLPVIPMEAASC